MNIDTDKHIRLQPNQSLDAVAGSKKSFQNKVIQYNAIACQSGDGNFDSKAAISASQDNLIALGAKDSLQEMLVSQMTSIHILQQKTIALANKNILTEQTQSLITSAIKLSNCFTNQAALLAKLQGIGGQKIIIERIEVHQFAQTAVGNVIQGG